MARRMTRRRSDAVNNLDGLRKMLWMDSLPDQLLHRDEEIRRIEEFCRLFITQKDDCYSLYLGGVPGTGKTSCVLQTINELEQDKKLANKFKFIHLNGGEMVRPEDLYVHFYHKLKNTKERISASNAFQQVSNIFSYVDKKRLPIILLLDELDFLVNKNQTVIYNIFNFAGSSDARLAIISITNTFDFCSRVLDSRIQSRIGTNRIHFQPYDWAQIEAILRNRLENCDKLVEKSAIQLASRKVANMSGDIRKALDIMRRAVDIAIENDCEKLSMKQIDEACKESKNTYRMCLVRSMSSHEFVLFKAVYGVLHQSSLQEALFGTVFRNYEQLCISDGMEALGIDEVLMLVQSGIDTGFYKLSKAPGSMNRKISLGLDMYEARYCLEKSKDNDN